MIDEVKVNFQDRVISVTRALGRIDMDNLKSEVSEVGGDAVWWGVYAAQSDTLVRRSMAVLEEAKARLGKEFRRASAPGDKLTERMVEEYLITHAEVKNMKEALLQAEESAAILRSTKFAIEQKQRTLATMAGLVGQEMAARREPLLPPDRREPVARRPA